MTVLYNNTQDDSDYVLVAEYSSSPTKEFASAVQKRLQTYKPTTSPTKEQISNQLHQAQVNRSNVLKAKVEIASAPLTQFKVRRTSFDASEQLKKELQALHTIERETLATQSLNELMKQRVDALKTHNDKVDSIKSSLQLKEEQDLESLRLLTDEKLRLAALNREEVISNEVRRVSIHNTIVAETSAKVEFLFNGKLEELGEMTYQKGVQATEARESLKKLMLDKVSNHNEIVKLRSISVPNQIETERLKILTEGLAKMEHAIKQHNDIIDAIVCENHTHNVKAKEAGIQALHDQEVHRNELAASTIEHAKHATEIHDQYIQARVQHTSTTPSGKKCVSPGGTQTSPSCTAKLGGNADKECLTKESILLKLEEAAARREVILTQRGEQAGHHYSEVRQKALEVNRSPMKNKDGNGREKERECTPAKKLHNDDEVIQPFCEEDTTQKDKDKEKDDTLCVDLRCRMGGANHDKEE